MKLTIKLEDPKYCNFCPCLHTWLSDVDGLPENDWCNELAIELKRRENGVIRPQKCIKENGE